MSVQCSSVVQKAYRVLNMFFRCFLNCNRDLFLKCYTCYVRPLLEYSSQAWSPSYLADIDKIERVQRYFTRRLFAKLNLDSRSYPDRITILKLEPLELRRLRSDLVMVFKCLNGEVDACKNMFSFSANTFTRGHLMKLNKRNFKKNVLKHSFSVRVIDAWNSLPTTVNGKFLLNSTNSKIFKKLLENVNLNSFLKFDRNL